MPNGDKTALGWTQKNAFRSTLTPHPKKIVASPPRPADASTPTASSRPGPRADENPSNGKAKSGRSPRFIRRVLIATFVGGVLAVVGIVTAVQGRVAGVEFAPSHFQSRRFSFYEIPLLHLQITPIKRERFSHDIVRFIRQTQLPPATGQPSRWDVVRISQGPATHLGDASLLLDALRWDHGVGKTDRDWRSWTTDRPQDAKWFWSVIARLADQEMYLVMPPLLESAFFSGDDPQPTASNSPTDFQRQIVAKMRYQVDELTDDLDAADRAELATMIRTQWRSAFAEELAW